MKRNSLTTALLAGLAGATGIAATANAVNVNPDGVGGALIYPYYTVNKGNITTISVVNTTSQVKAVKVRFLEGRNSREVLDFNLYLSPFDVWVGAVIPADPNNNASPGRLVSPDRSCTVPQIPGAGEDFKTFAFDGSFSAPDHSQAQLPRYSQAERTREGYVEMIEMGVVGGAQATAATHGANGIPANCNVLVNSWAGGVWAATAGAANISLPTGGLYGSAAVFNAAEGVMYSYDAVALEGFYTNGTQPTALHSDPASVVPNLGSADSGGGVATSIVVANNGQSLITENWPGVSPTGAAGGWNAVSALFMHDNVFNEYVANPAMGGSTDWVVTFPTKRFFVDRAAPALRPFANIFFGTAASPGSCEPVTIGAWDREELSFTPLQFSPPLPQGRSLCYEAQVVTVNQPLTAAGAGFSSPSENLGSIFAVNISAGAAPGFRDGHMRLGFQAASQALTAPSQRVYRGLPVVGFATQKYINANVTPGVRANYSGTWEHKYSRNITGGTAP
jgi:hypothetical protein